MALVDAQARRRSTIESRVLRLLIRLINLVDWYSPASVASFTKEASDLVGAAQEALGGVTVEYLDAVLEELGLPRAKARTLPTQLRQVDPAIEWARPGEQYRYAKSIGASDAEALKAARDRTELLADADVSLAQQHATVTRLADYPKVIGYRRVIHPELTKGGTCGLCAVAADRLYRVDRLMPVHDRCVCGVLPATVRWDPGSPLNEGDLAKLYQQAGSTAADQLKRTRFTVAEHSELGPRLIAA